MWLIKDQIGLIMARWSDSVRLRDYYYAPRGPGVYEVGFVRNAIFNPVYVGKADPGSSIFRRLCAHYGGYGNKTIRQYLLERERDNLWCHWIEVSDPGYTEASLLHRFRIGKDGGLYIFNDKYEPLSRI